MEQGARSKEQGARSKEQGARTMDNGQWTMDKRLITFVCHTVEYISIFVLGFFSEAGFVLGFFSETVLVPFSTQCGAWFIDRQQ